MLTLRSLRLGHSSLLLERASWPPAPALLPLLLNRASRAVAGQNGPRTSSCNTSCTSVVMFSHVSTRSSSSSSSSSKHTCSPLFCTSAALSLRTLGSSAPLELLRRFSTASPLDILISRYPPVATCLSRGPELALDAPSPPTHTHCGSQYDSTASVVPV